MITLAILILLVLLILPVQALFANATYDDTYGDPQTLIKPSYIWVNSANWTALSMDEDDDEACDDSTSSQSCWSRPPLGFDTSTSCHYTYWEPDGAIEDVPQDRARVELLFTGECEISKPILIRG